MYFSTRDTSLTSPLKSLWYFPVMVHSCAAKITGENLLHISKNWHKFLLKSKKKKHLGKIVGVLVQELPSCHTQRETDVLLMVLMCVSNDIFLTIKWLYFIRLFPLFTNI